MAKYSPTLAEGAAGVASALSAAAVAGGGVVEVTDPGTYLVSTQLVIGANTTLYLGPGVILKKNFTSDDYVITNGGVASPNFSGNSNICIKGEGFIDAGGPDSNAGNGGFIAANCKNVLVEGITIINCNRWHAVEFMAVQNGTLRNVKARGYTASMLNGGGGGWWAGEAFQLDVGSYADKQVCEKILVTGCEVIGFGKLVGSHSSYAGKAVSGVRITDNYAYGTHHYAVGGENWADVVVSNNTFDSCNGGVQMWIPATDSEDVAHYRHGKSYVVANNTFKNTGAQNQYASKMVSCIQFVASPSGIRHYGIAVSNNTIAGTNTYGVRTVGGSRVDANHNLFWDGIRTAYSIK